MAFWLLDLFERVSLVKKITRVILVNAIVSSLITGEKEGKKG